MDIKESDILGADAGTHWYYRSKSAAVCRLLRGYRFSRILDVGAGSGFFSRELLRRTGAVSATCVDPNYGVERDDVESGKSLRFRRRVDPDSQSDLLLLMDVLEHVDDDRGLLDDAVSTLLPGTLVLVSVPAFQFMWSGHDEFLGHRRRYTLTEVESLLDRAGLELLAGCHYFGAVMPLAYLARKWSALRHPADARSDLQRHGALVNTAMTALCHLELPLMRLNRGGGLTVFCLARVPAR